MTNYSRRLLSWIYKDSPKISSPQGSIFPQFPSKRKYDNVIESLDIENNIDANCSETYNERSNIGTDPYDVSLMSNMSLPEDEHVSEDSMELKTAAGDMSSLEIV